MNIYEDVRTHTMIPEGKFYDNLWIADQVQHVRGCVVECGVWKGGMIAGIAARMGSHREYHLFDSFEGLPPAQTIDGPAAIKWQADKRSPTYYANCRAGADDAVEAMRKVGCQNYQIHEGWLEYTLRESLLAPIALLRIDVDWYDATALCLDELYWHVAIGGAVIFDDYDAWDGARLAIDEFLVEPLLVHGAAYYHIRRAE